MFIRESEFSNRDRFLTEKIKTGGYKEMSSILADQ